MLSRSIFNELDVHVRPINSCSLRLLFPHIFRPSSSRGEYFFVQTGLSPWVKESESFNSGEMSDIEKSEQSCPIASDTQNNEAEKRDTPKLESYEPKKTLLFIQEQL